jgi:hypothetical protein
VAVDRIKAFQAAWTDFLVTRKPGVLDRIGAEKTINDSLTAELKAAADQFAGVWKSQPAAA